MVCVCDGLQLFKAQMLGLQRDPRNDLTGARRLCSLIIFNFVCSTKANILYASVFFGIQCHPINSDLL